MPLLAPVPGFQIGPGHSATEKEQEQKITEATETRLALSASDDSNLRQVITNMPRGHGTLRRGLAQSDFMCLLSLFAALPFQAALACGG
ncbi:MAG: hypothetical protein ACT4QC_22785 [Planctomycetaceae bacterium]